MDCTHDDILGVPCLDSDLSTSRLGWLHALSQTKTLVNDDIDCAASVSSSGFGKRETDVTLVTGCSIPKAQMVFNVAESIEVTFLKPDGVLFLAAVQVNHTTAELDSTSPNSQDQHCLDQLRPLLRYVVPGQTFPCLSKSDCLKMLRSNTIMSST